MGLGILRFLTLAMMIFIGACTPGGTDSQSSADKLLAEAHRSLMELSYYNGYLLRSSTSYVTVGDLFFSLPDTLKGNYYSYYTEAGGVDGYPWPLSYSSSNSYKFGFILNSALDTLYVQKVFPQSAAAQAGIVKGDKIVAIDSLPLEGNPRRFTGLTTENVPYTFTIVRGGSTVTQVISKNIFTAPLAYSDTLGGGVGYIALSTFYDLSAASDFKRELEATSSFGVTILDLRGNGGGYVNQLDTIVDLFTEPYDTLVLTRSTHLSPQLTSYEGLPNSPVVGDRKFVILMDGASASASEMFVAAMVHNHQTPTVGSTTYGKAIGQVGLDYSALGGGYGQTTVMGFVMVDGTEYQGVGIVPDHEVNPTADEYSDLQLTKALEVAQGLLSIPAVRGRGGVSTPSTRTLFNSSMPRTPPSVPEWGSVEIGG
jgi:carboxyl-terminal processing protease